PEAERAVLQSREHQLHVVGPWPLERHGREARPRQPAGERRGRAGQHDDGPLASRARDLDGHGRKPEHLARGCGQGICHSRGVVNNSVRLHLSMAIGLVAGLAAAGTKSPLLLALAGEWLRPIGTVFLNSLSMVVIPLVVTALFLGVAGLGDLGRLGRLGIRTLAFFWGST